MGHALEPFPEHELLALGRLLQERSYSQGRKEVALPGMRLDLVSFGNSLLYTAVLAQIYQTHLDPRIGFLHEANYRRHSLNLDVAEVFKPVLVDRLIFRLVRRGQVKAGHFLREGDGVFLSEAGRRLVVEEWEKTLQTTYRHLTLRRSVSYRTTLRLELYKLEKHLIGEAPYVPYRLR